MRTDKAWRYGIPSLDVLSRVLLGSIFVISGFNKITNFSETAAYMSSEGIFAPSFFLALALVIELVGGLALWFGIATRLSALALCLYLIPVTLVFHDFWSFQGMERSTQLVNFLKNITIMGGLLHVTSFGAGRISVDASAYHAGGEPRSREDRLRKVS